MSKIEVDTTRLPLLLHELRLPAIARLWPEFSERADKESWPAARFLSALAELEIAERGQRRIRRNLAEARLLPDKTLDDFDFSVVPMLSKARVMALAAGDTWLDKASNLLLFGSPGAGKSQVAAAIGRALVENGYRALFMRTTDLVQRLQQARQALCPEAGRQDPRARTILIVAPSDNQQTPLPATICCDILVSSAVADLIRIDTPSIPTVAVHRCASTRYGTINGSRTLLSGCEVQSA